MNKIALTGNIGSGKSTVARVFEILGVPVFRADIVGHNILLNKDIAVKVAVLFGDDVINNGKIDRKALAGIVFKNNEALRKLNAIIHPRVLDDFHKFAKTFDKKKYVIFESALIYEADLKQLFDDNILVYAPAWLKIKRVMKRDNCNSNSVISRLSNQIDDDLKLQDSNHVIVNDDISLVIPQIIELHKVFEGL